MIICIAVDQSETSYCVEVTEKFLKEISLGSFVSDFW